MRFFVFLLALGMLIPTAVAAKYDPRDYPNNKFGIHIIDPNDLADAATLVNSSGGDWGYVTVVIAETDKNSAKWQEAFNEMRRRHLIPIVRLAATSIDDYWSIPTVTAGDDWVRFLNELNWPVENRYVALFNEPNHAKEWGNTISPESYADAFVYLATKLKAASADFFILPAAMDVSAENWGGSLDAEKFVRRMTAYRPEMLDLIDGLNSHSYPNPGFSGRPTDRGRGTLRSYLWEKQLYESLGLKKNLPVFITETGWQHSEGKVRDARLLQPDKVAEFLDIAMESVWSDPQVTAVTPFVLNYQDYPFDHFSWKNLGNSGIYSHFSAYQAFPKLSGKPRQRHQYALESSLLPFTLVSDSGYVVSARLKNLGQDIISVRDGYRLVVFTDPAFLYTAEIPGDIEPYAASEIWLSLHTPEKEGIYMAEVALALPGQEEFLLEKTEIMVVPPPAIEVKYHLAWKSDGNTNMAKVLIYDKDDRLIHEYSGLKGILGSMLVSGLKDVIPGEKYRVVLIVPGYLPRQAHSYILSSGTKIMMPRLLPFDPDYDGAFTIGDLFTTLQKAPFDFIHIFFF